MSKAETRCRAAVGVGCRSGSPRHDITALLRSILATLDTCEVIGLFTHEAKHHEAGLHEAAAELGLSLTFWPSHVLRAVPGVTVRSSRVEAAVGVSSVAEAAALVGAGPGASLLVPRVAARGVTCAVALTSGSPPMPWTNRESGGRSQSLPKEADDARQHSRGAVTGTILSLAAQAGLDFPTFEPGTVWLVGAGPGDPGLLTLHALNALAQADVIVFDALIGEDVLRLARPGARREFAGKRGGRPSPKQGDISDRLIELAQAGDRVLRLKGGDPFVFGRGGEEALALVSAGVAFRIVPGITAGIGGLGYAAIPATTRDTNHAVVLATGHKASDGDKEQDWRSIARTGLPIIIYMGMTFLDRIAKELMAGGLRTDTPVAIVMEATTVRQRVLVSQLDRVSAEADRDGFAAPAIVAVGSIVALQSVLGPYALTVRSGS